MGQKMRANISTSMRANEGFKVQYHQRSGNKSADRIAKETSTFTSLVPKLYSIVPMWLNSCIKADKPNVRLWSWINIKLLLSQKKKGPKNVFGQKDNKLLCSVLANLSEKVVDVSLSHSFSNKLIYTFNS